MSIAKVIMSEGNNNSFIWKHPCEDFESTTQLIVHESQEAIFFMNGQALDLFGPGRHTLETQNIPKIGKFFKRATNDTPFHCEVYFINKTVQMSIKWGTDSKVRFIEPNYGFPIEIGACGEMNLEVADARKLLVKLVGTTKGIAWGDKDGYTKSLQACFKPLISNAVKAHLVGAIKSRNIDLFEIDENLESLSEVLRAAILPGFEEYGLTIPQFYISNVLLPDPNTDSNFKKMRDLHTIAIQTKTIQAETMIKTAYAEQEVALAAAKATVVAAERQVELERQATLTEKEKSEAEREIIRAQAEAQKQKLKGIAEAEVMAAKGYNQRDVLAADVQKAYAEGIGNMNISGGAGGGVAGDMIGLGVGIAAAGAVAPKLGEMFKGLGDSASNVASSTQQEERCAKCGATLPANAKFCLECGEKIAQKLPEDKIVCPQCGITVNKGKFCPECGYKFITNCSKCGATVAPGAKFCAECGEKL